MILIRAAPGGHIDDASDRCTVFGQHRTLDHADLPCRFRREDCQFALAGPLRVVHSVSPKVASLDTAESIGWRAETKAGMPAMPGDSKPKLRAFRSVICRFSTDF